MFLKLQIIKPKISKGVSKWIVWENNVSSTTIYPPQEELEASTIIAKYFQ